MTIFILFLRLGNRPASMRHGNFTVWIEVEGDHAPEFCVESTINDAGVPVQTCWIPSTTGKVGEDAPFRTLSRFLRSRSPFQFIGLILRGSLRTLYVTSTLMDTSSLERYYMPTAPPPRDSCGVSGFPALRKDHMFSAMWN